MAVNLKTKLQVIAYYQIAGGILGFITTIWAMFSTSKDPLVVFLFICGLLLFMFSVFCGLQLLYRNINFGLKISIICQLLQVIKFSILGYGFKFLAGLSFSLGIDFTEKHLLFFRFNTSMFEIQFNNRLDDIIIGVNLVAIYLVYYIGTLRDESNKIDTQSVSANDILNSK